MNKDVQISLFRAQFLIKKREADIANIKNSFGLKPSTIDEVSKKTETDTLLVESVVNRLKNENEIDVMFKHRGQEYWMLRFFITKKNQNLFK